MCTIIQFPFIKRYLSFYCKTKFSPHVFCFLWVIPVLRPAKSDKGGDIFLAVVCSKQRASGLLHNVRSCLRWPLLLRWKNKKHSQETPFAWFPTTQPQDSSEHILLYQHFIVIQSPEVTSASLESSEKPTHSFFGAKHSAKAKLLHIISFIISEHRYKWNFKIKEFMKLTACCL